ncbi:MAG TPA: 2-amino-4-hydroxy-6-hydroxymethyldihydropteridine diphosphokinase [Candidatus Cloacimonas sp.]|jgi:2-amino-4-hydroxy-6-hydroxymethyldihydropteridine diphosphokinase|nr:2-amino-4-hydroxy-6-hydroxymethyldihydropteridine diphosphokinase [Candidatus Cloacimonas sp.]HNS84507.1 2-amino-4-hydroxy-6-hydroxymethyldihydropteridine diphosphokinase [Candidatus Cloacimonas sp.]HPA24347.1 2-amino-4-hydroxy-6-hydroxymethyldihydropteridine diphosphokinase [Candidatus Cloacimonas sp.]HPH93736.1 2-amino-4-hydroxy-6-hydroxymethyldihydropteridine diphosphokinase [Candidatus Cloacimonas sp.]
MIYYLCLGSNLNNPVKQIEIAIQRLENDPGIKILRSSKRIITEPYGIINQPDFLNQVLEVESSYQPQELMERLLNIEKAMGRVRRIKWEPRIIDIDILLAGDLVLDSRITPLEKPSPEVIIPHPDLHNREFALHLLNELIPDTKHPVMHKTIYELYYSIVAKEENYE